MRLFTVSILTVCLATSAFAHHPDREHKPVHPRVDVIPPSVVSWLPMSHRRKYNRPSNIGGKIMYHIAPSSQEAMAWHNATHRGYYEKDRPRIVMHYFYPKPWESMKIGARPKPTEQAISDAQIESAAQGAYQAAEQADAVAKELALEDPLDLPPNQPIAGEIELIEE